MHKHALQTGKHLSVLLAAFSAFVFLSGFTVEEDPVESHLPRPLSGPVEPNPGRQPGGQYLAKSPEGTCVYDASGKSLQQGSSKEYSYYPNGKVSRIAESCAHDVEELTYFSQAGLPVCRTSSHRDEKGAAILYHTYLYDSHGQLKYTRCADSGGFTKYAYNIRITYDDENRISTFSVYDEKEGLHYTNTYTYRKDGTVSLSITEFTGNAEPGKNAVRNHTTYEYDSSGRLLYRFFDITNRVLTQNREDYRYDAQGQLTDITLRQVLSSNSISIRNIHFDNTYNRAGLLSSVTSQTVCYEVVNDVAQPATLSRKKIEYFTYDHYGNLTRYSDGKGTREYCYSSLGSLLKQ